jgi:phosphatidylserine decarboxylase
VIDENKSALISPCDGKIMVHKIKEDSVFQIKDGHYSIYSMLRDKKLSENYKNGYCIVIRLSVDDYHRYCYIDNLKKSRNRKIEGVLHTVHPAVDEYCNIYRENSREYTLMKTENFDEVVQIEVGALFVGKIINNHEKGEFKRGQEKGMFEFGASTIVLLLKENIVDMDEDLITNTQEGFETEVKLGEKIGTRK